MAHSSSPTDPSRRRFVCREKSVAFDAGPVMVGILNVTDESFFDGGRFRDAATAMAQADLLIAEGAGVIDVGGQSTRPGFQELSVEEEIARVVPVIAALAARIAAPISIDTYKPAVARAAFEAGAHIVNDVRGLQGESAIAEIAAEFGGGVIVMHQEADFKHAPGDSIAKLVRFFDRSRQIARAAGVPDERLILDPGIGFGKTQEQNLEIMARIGELRFGGLPLLLGASRKSTIGNVLDLPVAERLEGTIATTVLAVWQGVEFIRVHDVRANARAAKMAAALRGHHGK
jgi:dihydropteroate synthase